MKEVEFAVPKNSDLRQAEKLVEVICARRGLQLAMKGATAAYPGSIHWHFKQPKQKGTLEVSLHIPTRRLWAKILKGRKAPWIDKELPELRRAIESALRAHRA